MLKQFLSKKLLRTDFLRNVATLLTGTAIAQVITLAVSLLLSRMYSPEEFGTYAFFVSLVSGVSIIVCGRFELAIILPKKDEDAQKLMNLSFLFTFFISLIFFLVVVFLVLTKRTSMIFLLAPLTTFLVGNFQILNNWANRKKEYKTISISRVIGASSNSILSLVFAYFSFTKLGLIFSHFLSALFTNFSFRDYFLKIREATGTKFEDLKQTFFEYSHFIKFNAFQAISDMLMINGIFYLLPIYFEKSTLGLFSFAIRILQAPMSLLGSSIAQVFFQEAANNKNHNISNSYLVISTIKKSSIVILPMPIILFFFGPNFFSFFFGERWEMAGEIAKVLSVWIFFDFIRATISQLPIVVNKQKQLLQLSVLGNILLFSVIIYFGINEIAILECFKYLTLLMSFYTLLIIVWIFKISQKN